MAIVDVPWWQIYLSDYLQLVGITILYYDHAITFTEEYKQIWKNPRSGASIYFLFNRYLAFFANFVVIYGRFAHFSSAKRSVRLNSFVQIDVNDPIVGGNLILRTYALYGRDKRIITIVPAVAAVLMGFSCWSVVGQTPDISLAEGCHISMPRTIAIRIAVAWEALFTFDLIIAALTLLRTYKERYHYRITNTNDLFALVVRDGAVYFVVMAFANLSNTVTFYILEPELRGILSTFATYRSR